MQRLAHNLILVLLVFISACSPSDRQAVDRLNSLSYAYHYKDLDSTATYARKALTLATNYDAGRAEALNNLAFVSIAKMDYKLAAAQLDSVIGGSDNQIELFIANIQQMRLCQRESRNKDFYDFSEKAQRARARIEEERSTLDSRQQQRLVYAESEFAIVTSTYYYYVGLEQPSIDALNEINGNGLVLNDTAQYLNYVYQIGAGGIISGGTPEEVNQTEWDYLMRCFLLAHGSGDVYWEANALQGMSEHLFEKNVRDRLIADNLPAMKFINPDQMPDSLLAGYLAERSLEIFKKYGDVYQVAGAYRTLASCYWNIGDYRSAIACLERALHESKMINEAPDLVASIRERLSLTYSALDDKPQSDYNRNIYLDMQDSTRQDRQLEARAEQLDHTLGQLNMMILAVALMILAVVIMLLIISYLRYHRDSSQTLDTLLEPLKQWSEDSQQKLEELNNRYEEINEERKVAELTLESNRRRNIENRAKVFLVNSVTPFIDRIIHEVNKLIETKENDDVRQERYKYVEELTAKINEYNDVLTQWIQLRQGQLSLRIESFPLQELFDVVKRSRMSFQLKGIELRVDNTPAVVKADRVMTLFMLNTLADNARKFTPDGGSVTLSATETPEFVEVSVTDTGKGIEEDRLQDIFNHKVNGGHGFGLMNCRGIIEQYKKTSKIFNISTLTAESTVGKGSRFAFRLPKGIARTLCLLAMFCMSLTTVKAQADSASIYSNKVYYANIAGDYSAAIAYADSAIVLINKTLPDSLQRMTLANTRGGEPAEITWLHRGFVTNYDVILELRNEVAVAALALHKWELYHYNNRVYTQLYKEISADKSLGDYVRTMQASSQTRTVAVILLVILLVVILLSYYLLYYRQRLYYRYCVEQVEKINRMLFDDISDEEKSQRIAAIDTRKYPDHLREIVKRIAEALKQNITVSKDKNLDIELSIDELHRLEYENQKYYISNNVLDNCLSTLKHETMYYPNRISQLLPSDSSSEQLPALQEVVNYYKELYTILSAQAMRQLDALRPDASMVDYLLELLRQESKGAMQISLDPPADNNRHTTVVKVVMARYEYRDFFVPDVKNIPFLVCRQIVREISESTHLRECGISTRGVGEDTVIMITLPQQLCNHLK